MPENPYQPPKEVGTPGKPWGWKVFLVVAGVGVSLSLVCCFSCGGCYYDTPWPGEREKMMEQIKQMDEQKQGEADTPGP